MRRTGETERNVLEMVGCTCNDLVKANCWWEDPRDFCTFNTVYAVVFPDGGPTRSTVRSQLMADAKVEVDVITYKALG
ncbi:Rid family hydrolase [uncultured Tateyamaria sp.]|uniref:RidA family protein n=1 Tax=Tateyamaria sp. 1078 TaxID=3417464 RepID=UPI002638DA05|nr:Rid family hydrolase [uncultured Tateyamaria sp.]